MFVKIKGWVVFAQPLTLNPLETKIEGNEEALGYGFIPR